MLAIDPLSREHRTGAHPECVARLDAIERALAAADPAVGGERRTFPPASVEQCARAHERGMLERSRALAEKGGGWIDADTCVSPRSFDAALSAAGQTIGAMDAVLRGEARHAMAIARPPGHHATRRTAMGFCLVNSVATAALEARARGHERVAILDIDVHHGNGTQDIFWEDPAVFYASLHRWPFYPGSGAADETGSGAGLGTTHNAPLRLGTPPARWHQALARALEKIAAHRPSLLLVSAGFDAYALDPIGGLDLEEEDFAAMGRTLRAFADAECGGRIVSTLEGGYNLDALGALVRAYLVPF